VFQRTISSDYQSRNEVVGPSPAYVVARAARDRLREEKPLPLPEGYDAAVLDQACWLLGANNEQPIAVSHRQAHELAEIAESLLAEHQSDPFLSVLDLMAVKELIAVVDR